MSCLPQRLKSLLTDESGQDLIEYALIAALIAVAAILAMKGLANKINNEFNAVGNAGCFCGVARHFDGMRMIVEARERGFRIRLRH